MIKKKRQVKIIHKRFILDIPFGYSDYEEAEYLKKVMFNNKLKDCKVPHQLMHILWNS